jgi:hypothetical protein
MIIIIMRGENFVAHLDGLGGTPMCRGTPVAHHWARQLEGDDRGLCECTAATSARKYRNITINLKSRESGNVNEIRTPYPVNISIKATPSFDVKETHLSISRKWNPTHYRIEL